MLLSFMGFSSCVGVLGRAFGSINQSINQNCYCANIPGEGQAQWRTKQIGCPKAKIQDSVRKRQQTIGCVGIYTGKAKSKRWFNLVWDLFLPPREEDWRERGKGGDIHNFPYKDILADVVIIHGLFFSCVCVLQSIWFNWVWDLLLPPKIFSANKTSMLCLKKTFFQLYSALFVQWYFSWCYHWVQHTKQ